MPSSTAYECQKNSKDFPISRPKTTCRMETSPDQSILSRDNGIFFGAPQMLESPTLENCGGDALVMFPGLADRNKPQQESSALILDPIRVQTVAEAGGLLLDLPPADSKLQGDGELSRKRPQPERSRSRIWSTLFPGDTGSLHVRILGMKSECCRSF